MAKESLFKAYDLRRKKVHTIGSPPAKIHTHSVNHSEWARLKNKDEARSSPRIKKKCSIKKGKKSKRLPKNAIDILRCRSGEVECLHCGKIGDDASCGTKCYTQFRKRHFIADKIDIKGPSKLGYGAYTKPGVHISKGQWLDEYIGELRPINDNQNDGKSLYRFEIPNVCVVDAERSGNWTRFINSNCRPNVKPWGDFVGKRHVILFQALRDIGPEEEVVFDYGKKYFEKAGFKCSCDRCLTRHQSQSQFR